MAQNPNTDSADLKKPLDMMHDASSALANQLYDLTQKQKAEEKTKRLPQHRRVFWQRHRDIYDYGR